ncbi:Def N-formylmethionyl-tRNA deformylase [uncultured Caudovirales phage]|uniref:Def N-formylmethionyl-tRNA deformylase n=1 Tax=uncultured Caudovirales phage TaxID=2100421 RepID=A0A6J5NVT2_9CAUD|nr:Def N-formylmethionyl-tRNA deformylase [uncultured Caudovirales phage]
MELVPHTSEILTKLCESFDFTNPPFDPIEFSKDLVKTMYDHNGIGLAANQVGIPYRIFAMRAAPENFVCFNPRIVQPSEAEIVLEEGCLTFKGLQVKVKRPQHVRVRFQTPNGETLTKQFTGISARIFQHELDHLDGIVFYNRANRYHREHALKKWKK